MNFKKPSRVIIVLSIALVAVLSVGLAVNRANTNNTSVGGNPLQRVFILENATDEQKFTRLLSVTLNPDGTAELATPPISSYRLFMPVFYTFADNELLIHYENGNEIARFEIAADDALIFRSSTVPLFADAGARYISDATPFVGYVDEITSSVASEQSLEEAMIIQDIAPEGLSLSTRTAESTLHVAFFHIFEAVYDFDYALNHEIRYIAVDVTEIFDDIHESLLTVLQAWCELNGYELLIDTYDGLVEAGLIVQPPDRSGFLEGLLFEFNDAEFDGETLTVSASKWRSPLGATGSKFTARFSDGNWVISTNIRGWWMS